MNTGLLRRLLILVTCFAWLFFPACSCTDTVGQNPDGTCVATSECSDGQECVDNVCVDYDVHDGDGDSDVPDGDGDSDGDSDTDGDNDGDGDQEPSCVVSVSCDSLGAQCGTFADGCGSTIHCGSCPSGHYCGSGEDRGTCLELSCTPTNSCGDMVCGTVSDGCGNTISCGTCPDGYYCGSGDDRGQCVALATECTPAGQEKCQAQGVECGTISDGCGSTIHCGSCAAGQFCGTGADKGTCLDIPACVPSGDCTASGVECGYIPDGCGGSIYCGGCQGSQVCGIGAEQGQCVDSSSCSPLSCFDLGAACGVFSDGCGSTINCGGCPSGTTCNGGQCAAASCVPSQCADLGLQCGVHPNGCGSTIDCGGCSEGNYCDSGQCEAFACQPLSCDDFNPGECGPHPDGCGGTINCGTCTAGLICGTGAQRGTCIEPSCVPLTCDDYDDINCGPVSDGCGGMTASCGTCTDPEICGGGGVPNVCGAENTGDCDGALCEYQVVCPAGGATTLTGTVYAPNGTLPIPNAVVYVPGVPLSELPPIESGASCVQCEDEDLGEPLTGTVSDFDGYFELRHVPADVAFPLVIKVGDWRRVVMIDPLDPCTTTPLAAQDTRLPTRPEEFSVHDNIPKTAIVTGVIDAIECVLHKLGVDANEFTRHNQSGAIHLYRANGGTADSQLADDCLNRGCDPWSCTDRDPGSCGGSSNTRANRLRANLANHLYDSADTLKDYDMVIMNCEGFANTSRSLTHRNNILDYVNSGGRVFASHYAYDWLYRTSELQDTATWHGSNDAPDYSIGFVDVSHPRGAVFWDWLQLVGADYPVAGPGGQPQIEIHDPRFFVQSINSVLATRWVYIQSGSPGHLSYNAVQQYTFDTPVYADMDAKCGRVAYSAFHVEDALVWDGNAFPTYCVMGDLSPQEKVLAFMLFDLAACVSETGEPTPPVCHPIESCAEVGAQCGQISDGCGGTLTCDPCPDGTACGVNAPNQCGGSCSPISCDEYGAQCGTIEDGCGNFIDCGDCPQNQVCGAGGQPNTCGCEPLSCADHGMECGTVPDGCGGTIDCGDCPAGTSCGGSGVQGICGCDALTCADHGAECGTVPDGCGGTLDCGDCPAGLSCGGGGLPNTCGCVALSCEDHGLQCGAFTDGCGGTLECGGCPDGQECGAGGIPNVCGDDCEPLSCADHGAECGQVYDGCGQFIPCGDCPDGTFCGAGGVPNLCACEPLSCEDHGAQCGQVSDGCGGTLDCGDCPDPLSCGAEGIANMCGCEPLSCEDHGAECGTVSDGCGGSIACGDCPDTMECENFVCIVPECRPTGDECARHDQCCSGICGAGTCIAN